jgi:hypothetical protein
MGRGLYTKRINGRAGVFGLEIQNGPELGKIEFSTSTYT